VIDILGEQVIAQIRVNPPPCFNRIQDFDERPKTLAQFLGCPFASFFNALSKSEPASENPESPSKQETFLGSKQLLQLSREKANGSMTLMRRGYGGEHGHKVTTVFFDEALHLLFMGYSDGQVECFAPILNRPRRSRPQQLDPKALSPPSATSRT
jgi:hypothetical protein